MLSLLMFAACLCGAVAQNDAMFVYRNDGQINAFLKVDIDSMRYSHIGLDGLEHYEYVVQEVWTADSVYRIPLAAIDSISFVTPPTVYKNDVTRIDGPLLDYIIGCDGLTLKLKSTTPYEVMPHQGDKLVLLEGCVALPYGFSGIVSEIRSGGDVIDVVCEQAYLEDLFDSFCSVSTMYGSEDAPPVYITTGGPERAVYNPDDRNFDLGPFTYDVSGEISNGTTPNSDLAMQGEASVSLSINPTFRVHTFLILGDGCGTYFNSWITGDINLESDFSVYGNVEYSHDIEMAEVNIAIPYTAGLVKFYFVPGVFGRIGATFSSSVSASRKYAFFMAYDYSSKGESVIKPLLKCPLVSTSTDIEGGIDGSAAFGAFIETGFHLLSRDLAKVYVRGEYGWQVNGDFVLLNSDIVESENNTRLYERIKSSSIETGPFMNATMGSSVLNDGPSVTLGEGATLRKRDIVPTFSNTDLTRSSGSSSSVDAFTQMSGDCLFPVSVGFRLLDDNENTVADFESSDKYTNQGGSLNHTFTGIDDNNSYTVYPKVKLLGFDILASPSAQLGKKVIHSCPDENHPHAIDLGLPSGTKWCCCNVGASLPDEYGGYYAWGETNEKSYYYWDNYAYINSATGQFIDIGSDIAGTQYDVARVRMGAPWQMPTKEQIQELIDCCTWQWTQRWPLHGEVDGQLVTGPNGGQIFLPAAGERWTDDFGHDHLSSEGRIGGYWSSSLLSYKVFVLWFSPNFWNLNALFQYEGLPVRPVCP